MEVAKKEENGQAKTGAENAAPVQLTAEQLEQLKKTPPVYKFDPVAYADLGAYLLTRPMKDVKGIYNAFYRHGQKDPFYKADSVNRLLEYLSTCPMGEAEPITNMLIQGGGLLEYRADPNAQPPVAKEEKKASDGEQPAPAAESK